MTRRLVPVCAAVRIVANVSRVPRRRLAALLTLAALVLPAGALANTRLEGEFMMNGRVTAAHDVPGERVGERVNRIWDFVAPCPAGQCERETLVRDRASGSDTITIRRPRGVFNYWVGRGSFYAPLRCGSRTYARGERVRFTIRVRISAIIKVNGAGVATRVSAHYADRERTNLTRCVAALGRDAAVYTGTLVTPPAGQSGPTPAPD